MLGMGWPEIAVIGIVAMLVFGPERLPDLARQLGGFLRTVRQMAENAKNDLGREIGHDLSELDLRELDPREMVRRSMLDESVSAPVTPRPPQRKLRPGERPPFDAEAT